jgi:hypothetical protein
MPSVFTRKLCIVCNTNERFEKITRMQKIIRCKNLTLSSKQKIAKWKCSDDNKPDIECTILWNEIDRLQIDLATNLEELRSMYKNWDVI